MPAWVRRAKVISVPRWEAKEDRRRSQLDSARLGIRDRSVLWGHVDDFCAAMSAPKHLSVYASLFSRYHRDLFHAMLANADGRENVPPKTQPWPLAPLRSSRTAGDLQVGALSSCHKLLAPESEAKRAIATIGLWRQLGSFRMARAKCCAS